MKRNGATKLEGADRHFGYRFAVDGVCDLAETQELTSLSKTKLYDLSRERKIRRGKIGKKVVFCRRSIMEYLGTVEV